MQPIANAVLTALPAVDQTTKVIENGKVLEEKVTSTVARTKLNTMVTTLQIGLWTMKKNRAGRQIFARKNGKHWVQYRI